MNMLLLLKAHCRNLICVLLTSRHTVTLSSWCGECPNFVADGTYWLAVQQWAKNSFRQADKTGQCLRELPPCFPELSKVFKCAFLEAHICVLNFSSKLFFKTLLKLWTSINASTGPGLVMPILKLYCDLHQGKRGSDVWPRGAVNRILYNRIQGLHLFSAMLIV